MLIIWFVSESVWTENLSFVFLYCQCRFMQIYLPDWPCLSSTHFFGSQTIK